MNKHPWLRKPLSVLERCKGGPVTSRILRRIVAEHMDEKEHHFYRINLEHRFTQAFDEDDFLWSHSIKSSPVLLCAHVDKVSECPGYDDRLGVAIAETLHLRERLACDVLLTDGEETGNSSVRRVPEEYWERCYFCLVLDRRGGFDVVNSYHGRPTCSEDFAKAILQRAPGWHLQPGGLGSDAEVVAQHLPTVNLSVGYMNEHSTRESYNPAWHWNAYCLVKRCIEERDAIMENVSRA